MIFHTIRTITIGEFADMVTHNDINTIKRIKIWLPKFAIKKAYSKLLYEYNKTTNKKEVKEVIEKDKHNLSTILKINIQYSSLIELIDIQKKIKLAGSEKASAEINSHIIELYKLIYNREPKSNDDYERVYKDRELAIKRFKQQNIEDDNKDEGIDFEALIKKVEEAIAPVTIRDKKLYTLNGYIANAALKMKNNV